MNHIDCTGYEKEINMLIDEVDNLKQRLRVALGQWKMHIEENEQDYIDNIHTAEAIYWRHISDRNGGLF